VIDKPQKVPWDFQWRIDMKALVDKIKWLGHDSFQLDFEKTIYIDPYQVSPKKKADIILVTHEHFDHCSPDDIARLKKNDTVIITEKNTASKIIDGDIRILRPGETLSLDDIKVEAVCAYNINKAFHPKANGWLGFIIEVQDVRIYHAGDTDFIPEMNDIQADIALLPVSGKYVMTSEEAVQAALAIQPKIAIPMHYGAIVGNENDAEKFRKALQGKIEVVILQKQ
jgi:L-ascorbate metabolism protein UlaG (beta-lactamase superfamily)